MFDFKNVWIELIKIKIQKQHCPQFSLMKVNQVKWLKNSYLQHNICWHVLGLRPILKIHTWQLYVNTVAQQKYKPLLSPVDLSRTTQTSSIVPNLSNASLKSSSFWFLLQIINSLDIGGSSARLSSSRFECDRWEVIVSLTFVSCSRGNKFCNWNGCF